MPEFDQSGADARVSLYGKSVVPGDTPIKVDTSASLQVNTEGQKATYSATVQGSAAFTTPQDVFTLTGSATKTVHITRVRFTASATTGASLFVGGIVRSTANTGGTSTAPVRVPHDSNNTAATATSLVYSAGPTLGTSVGLVVEDYVGIPATGGVMMTPLVWDFGNRNEQSVILRGIGQVFAITFVGAGLPAGFTYTAAITWTEE